MIESNIKATFKCDIAQVWNTVTSLTDYDWRSDISEIRILGEDKFAEYTKDGYETVFTITARDTYSKWEFDMNNTNMSGHWTGVFSKNGENTVIDFTESVKAKKFIMRPFIRSFLKKQQSQYVSDLKKALEMSENR